MIDTAMVGLGSVGKRARGKRCRGAGKPSTVGAVFSSGCSEASRVRFSEGAILLEEIADFPMIEKIEPDPENSHFSQSEKIQNLPHPRRALIKWLGVKSFF